MVYLVASVHWGVGRAVQAGDQVPAWGGVVDLGECCMGSRDTIDTVDVVPGPKELPGKAGPMSQRQLVVVRVVRGELGDIPQAGKPGWH